MLDELSNLIGHQGGSGLEESSLLILVEVILLLSQDIGGRLSPVGDQKRLDALHLTILVRDEVL